MNEGRRSDKTLVFVVLALMIIGAVMVASAGVLYAQTRFGDEYFFLKRQIIFGILPGTVLMLFLAKYDYHKLGQKAFWLFALSIVLLVLVFIPGIGAEIYGANRWIRIGPLSFQPSEMAKLTLMIYLAAWLASKGKKRIQDMTEGLTPFVVILGIASILILLQPDTGTLGVIVLASLAVYFVSGARMSHVIAIVFAGCLALVMLIKIAPYRMNRFLVFLNPDLDPSGIGYQINQAFLALGSGGLFGLGLGHSRQKFNYLPEPVGDSIFAIIGEELGMIGAIVIISLFVVLAVRGYRIAQKAPDEFGRLMCVGIVSLIVFQAFTNIGAIVGIIPFTGIPLPFISYGGTSLVFMLAGVGILLNVSRQTKLE
ncbi:MAG: putative lipid II flippase FtsW [Candidatus Moranbacteria bacterium]|nr:putative lipid II flippase FtsW [Candidatus Moranbacteria bacterium]